MKINLYLLFISVLFGSNIAVDPDIIPETNDVMTIATERRNNNITMMRNTTTSTRKLKFLNVNFSEDGFLNFTELSKKYIGRAEEFDVITEDGYILKLFHIPGNEKNIALFGHGMLSSSDDFLIRGNISLIYMVAEKGFDVWAMNFRGNRYSRNHVTLNPDVSKKFWQYSMHEMGVYDYKAVIDFILYRTGQKLLNVIGHSEGTSAFFVLMTKRPEYNNKVNIFIGLSPACFLQNIGRTATVLFRHSKEIARLFELFNIEEFFGYYSLAKKAVGIICTQSLLNAELCFTIMGLLTGFNKAYIEPEFIPTIIGHFPAGTARKNLLHYAQVQRLDKFCHYDYGVKNFDIYDSLDPPLYDLKKVSTKVAMFAGKGDLVVGIEDIKRLKKALPNVVHYQVVSDDTFNHLDYLWSRIAHSVLYQYVIDILLKHNTSI